MYSDKELEDNIRDLLRTEAMSEDDKVEKICRAIRDAYNKGLDDGRVEMHNYIVEKVE